MLLRWLIACRASVLPLTLFSVLFGCALARPTGVEGWLLSLLILLALLLAHAANNLINDYLDHRHGLDRENYFRAQYGVHLLEHQVCDTSTFLRYLWTTGASALALGIALSVYLGGWIYFFTLAGAVLVLFYTYPLKHWALGELAVLLAWGPLMVGGTYLALTGYLNVAVLAAGVVYGLGPAVVILAKHTDKVEQDAAKGVHTLPVLLAPVIGEAGLRRGLIFIAALQVLTATGLAAVWSLPGMLGVWLGLPALIRLVRVANQPRPSGCPPAYPPQAWPLWYTSHAFLYARDAGGGLLLGILLQALLL